MRKIIEFNLPEEREEFELYNSSPKMHRAIYEFTQYLRNKLKYTEEKGSFEEVQKEWQIILSEEYIDPYA